MEGVNHPSWVFSGDGALRKCINTSVLLKIVSRFKGVDFSKEGCDVCLFLVNEHFTPYSSAKRYFGSPQSKTGLPTDVTTHRPSDSNWATDCEPTPGKEKRQKNNTQKDNKKNGYERIYSAKISLKKKVVGKITYSCQSCNSNG
jgi:hypothetical protein